MSAPAPGEPRHGVMRDWHEIQRSHDLLQALLAGDIPGLLVEPQGAFHAAMDVLCWVLGHDHNPAFAENLEQIEQEFERRGIVVMERKPD
jgi:hypothetical protein